MEETIGNASPAANMRTAAKAQVLWPRRQWSMAKATSGAASANWRGSR